MSEPKTLLPKLGQAKRDESELAAPLLGYPKKLGMSGHLAMTPGDLSNMVPAWNSPLPSTNKELLKALTDGATGAKEYGKETADRFKEMHGESLKDIPNVPIGILRKDEAWVPASVGTEQTFKYRLADIAGGGGGDGGTETGKWLPNTTDNEGSTGVTDSASVAVKGSASLEMLDAELKMKESTSLSIEGGHIHFRTSIGRNEDGEYSELPALQARTAAYLFNISHDNKLGYVIAPHSCKGLMYMYISRSDGELNWETEGGWIATKDRLDLSGFLPNTTSNEDSTGVTDGAIVAVMGGASLNMSGSASLEMSGGGKLKALDGADIRFLNSLSSELQYVSDLPNVSGAYIANLGSTYGYLLAGDKSGNLFVNNLSRTDALIPFVAGGWVSIGSGGGGIQGPPGQDGAPGEQGPPGIAPAPAWELNFSIYGNSNSYDLNSNNGVSIFEFSRSDGSQIQPADFKQYSEVSLGWHLSSDGSNYQSYLARLRPSFFNLPFPSGNDNAWKYTESSSGDASVALEFTYEGMVCKQPINAFKFYRNANDKIVLGIMYGPAYTATGSVAGKIFVNTGAPICRLGVRGGIPGPQGLPGQNGQDGAPGIQGPPGQDGLDGNSGAGLSAVIAIPQGTQSPYAIDWNSIPNIATASFLVIDNSQAQYSGRVNIYNTPQNMRRALFVIGAGAGSNIQLAFSENNNSSGSTFNVNSQSGAVVVFSNAYAMYQQIASGGQMT